jgi:hypothetical protein
MGAGAGIVAGAAVDVMLVAAAGVSADTTTGVAVVVVGTAATVAVGPECATTAVRGAGAASPAVFERRRLAGDPPSTVGRRDDDAPAVALSSESVRPSDAAVARAMSPARKGSLVSSIGVGATVVVATWVLQSEKGCGWCGWGLPVFALPLPFAFVVLVALVTVAGAGAGGVKGGNSSLEISTTEAGEERRAAWGVGVISESMGAGVESLSQPYESAV